MVKQKDYAVVVVVADNSPSSKEFHNSSQRFVCRLVETVCQQVHGGEALVSLCRLSSGSDSLMILCVLSRRGSDSLMLFCLSVCLSVCLCVSLCLCVYI